MKNHLTLFILLITGSLFAQLPVKNVDFKTIILDHHTGLKSTDLEGMKLSASNTDAVTGVQHFYFNQYYKNIPIHNAVLGLHLDANNQYVFSTENFFRNTLSVKFNNNLSKSPEDFAKKAIFSTLDNHSETINLQFLNQVNQTSTFQCKQIVSGEIKVDPVWLKQESTLILCWNVNWLSLDGQNWWNVRVNSQTGDIVDQNNWIAQCENHNITEDKHSNLSQKATFPAEGSGQGGGTNGSKYKVLARPIESPNHGNMSVLTDPSDSLSSPFSWHDTNGNTGSEYTITRGNNVYAYEDKNRTNSPGYSPNGGTSLNFDFPFDKNKKHTDYLDAAITNLFYWNNLMHDVWYHYGFDDASGNFQFNNYGRGGFGSDEVMAEAQDGSGTNNANFGTPPDGQNPRMQMFVWNVSSASLLLRVNEPSSVARQYVSVLAGFGPRLTTTPINGNLILADDGSNAPTLACDALKNGLAMKNQIALIDRGNCTFLEKVTAAQNAGARAVIVINNVGGNPITMGGTGGAGITIPSIMITNTDGNALKNLIKSNQTVKCSLYDSIGANAKQYDSDFDNGIICHEYGHGISNRLTGGAANSNCLSNQEQMGEGWSDFFGLVLTHKPGDQGTDRRGIGTYAIDEPTNGGGIRNYPYSTSLSVNPVTYNNIKTFSVPHGVGSVWCSMLWDMYWNLIDKYGYDSDIYYGTGGNNIAMKLVIDGLKLQPCNPGFTDGRDAILLADRINNKGANQQLIWQTFARRGLGFSANQGSSNDRSDGQDAFDLPKFDLPEIQKTTVSESPNGDTINYKIVLTNTTLKTLYNLTLVDTLINGLQFVKADQCFDGQYNNPVYTATIDSIKSGDSLVCKIQVRVAAASYTQFIETSDFEGAVNDWKDSVLAGTGNWFLSTAKKKSGVNSYFIGNPATASDRFTMKSFDLTQENLSLIFYHYYNTENGWDGAVVELLKNGIWEDLGPFMVENGYNNIIQTNPQSNISGREAFTGNSNQMIKTVVDLSSFAGDTTFIRFRMVSDAAQGSEGWYLDDISLVKNYTSVKNTAYISSGDGSTNASSASTMVLFSNKASVKPKRKLDFKVLPNPFDNEILIKSNDIQYRVILTDILGRTVLQKENLSREQKIETSALKPGTYFLTIETSKGREVFKLVK